MNFLMAAIGHHRLQIDISQDQNYFSVFEQS
jgi:hypothetical protein